MKKPTALDAARALPLPTYARAAMDAPHAHPQVRTLAFHEFYGAPIRSQQPDRTFSHMDNQRVAFRTAFILSEVFELMFDGLGLFAGMPMPTHAEIMEQCLKDLEEGSKRDLVKVADALADLNVVVNGFAIELGIDMRLVDQEICASNFTKADENGRPIIGDGTNGPLGKVLKGPNFVEPQIATVLRLGDE